MKGQASLLIALAAASSTQAFTGPTVASNHRTVSKAASIDLEVPFFVDVVQEEAVSSSITTKKAKKPSHKEGIFSPVVYWAKDVMGDQRLNKVRGKVIALHSDAIKGFVSTADSEFGESALKFLFRAADKNGNGKIEEEELELALQTLGFKWLKPKQVRAIFERAGGAEKGYITLEEWMAEAPKTLRTNLVKLAKTNGGEMGFLV